jgi:hypothetical protein
MHNVFRPTTALLLVLALAAVARVGLFAFGPASDLGRAMEPDSRRYVELGGNLATHRAFAKAEEEGIVHVGVAAMQAKRGQSPPPMAAAGSRPALHPEVFRTPGYPLLIAAVQWLGLPLHAVLAVQCVMSVAAVWLVYALGVHLLGSRAAALTAAAIVALHPAEWLAPNSVLAETLFTTLLLAGVYTVARRDRHPVGAAMGGLAFGLAALVRPVGVFLGIAAAMWQVAASPTRRGLTCAALLLTMSLLPATAWMARNDRIGAGWTLSSVSTINGLYYTAAHLRIADRGGDLYDDWADEVATLHDELDARTGADGDVLATARQMTREHIRADRNLYARLLADSAVKFFTDHSLGTLYERLGLTWQATGMRDRLLRGQVSLRDAEDRAALARLGAAGAWMGVNALLLLATLAGLGRLVWVGRWRAALLLGGMVFYFVLATQTNGLERFRWPVLGLQALIAASALFAHPAARGTALPDATGAVADRDASLRRAA